MPLHVPLSRHTVYTHHSMYKVYPYLFCFHEKSQVVFPTTDICDNTHHSMYKVYPYLFCFHEKVRWHSLGVGQTGVTKLMHPAIDSLTALATVQFLQTLAKGRLSLLPQPTAHPTSAVGSHPHRLLAGHSHRNQSGTDWPQPQKPVRY